MGHIKHGDAVRRLTEWKHVRNSAGTEINRYTWTYDALGRPVTQSSADGSTTYQYDAASQVTAATHSSQTSENYQYDANGNRTNLDTATSDNNRLFSDDRYDYQYDAEGNRTRRTERATGKSEVLAWDHRNRLTSVTTFSAIGTKLATAEFTYDVFDRRIARKVDADGNGVFETTQRFVYDGEDLILAFSGSTNVLTNRYLYGPATDEILADEKITTGTAGTVTWSLGDNLGTIRDLVQYNAATGTTTVVNHVRYDTFGQIVGQTNTAFQPWFAYTGREWDPAVGLYFYRARWYDPRAGRFTSEDPLGFAAGDANLSRYVGNAATLWVDPSGMEPTSPYANGAFTNAGYAEYLQSMQAGTGLPSTGLGGNQWDKLDYAANFCAGWGAALTFGATNKFRSWMGINQGVDPQSNTYALGYGVGILNGLPIISAGGIRVVAAGSNALIARVGAATLPYGVPVGLSVRMSRFFATSTGYQQVIAHSRMWQYIRAWNQYVSTLRFGRYQKGAVDCLTFQMHHWAIPQTIAKASQSSGLTRLAHAGWNLIPIPTGWNRFIGCSGVWFNVTRISVATSPVTAAMGGYGTGRLIWHCGQWIWCDD